MPDWIELPFIKEVVRQLRVTGGYSDDVAIGLVETHQELVVARMRENTTPKSAAKAIRKAISFKRPRDF